MSHYRIDFSSLSWHEPMVGVRHKFRDQDGRRLRLVEYTKGMPPHWCERGHVGMILEGEFEIRFAEDVVVFHPGDGLFIPPGPQHRHMALTLTQTVQVVFVEDE